MQVGQRGALHQAQAVAEGLFILTREAGHQIRAQGQIGVGAPQAVQQLLHLGQPVGAAHGLQDAVIPTLDRHMKVWAQVQPPPSSVQHQILQPGGDLQGFNGAQAQAHRRPPSCAAELITEQAFQVCGRIQVLAVTTQVDAREHHLGVPLGHQPSQRGAHLQHGQAHPWPPGSRDDAVGA